MAQALGQLARGLERSLSTYDVCDDDGRDPVDSVTHAVNALSGAVELLNWVGPLLDQAQAAISRQGYRTTALVEVDRSVGRDRDAAKWSSSRRA